MLTHGVYIVNGISNFKLILANNVIKPFKFLLKSTGKLKMLIRNLIQAILILFSLCYWLPATTIAHNSFTFGGKIGTLEFSSIAGVLDAWHHQFSSTNWH